VNGSVPEVRIIKPFEDAFELMKKILFQPFNLGKWCVLGFAAFLSGHVSAGGFNFPFGGFPSQHRNENLVSSWEEWKPWLPIAIPICAVLILALIILFSWLKARGNFIFTDCLARNRAAIVDPWREYRREANSYFLFLLLVMLGAMALFGLVALIVLIPLGLFSQGLSNDIMTPLFVVFLVLLFLVWICCGIFFAVTTYFMVPLMFVRRCRAVDAFRQVVRLIVENAGSFVLFFLFGICLLFGTGIISGIATCATCCLAALPYVGTVILLPVFVCLRAYGLLFIRQFGPDYDVWAASPPQTSALIPPPLPS